MMINRSTSINVSTDGWRDRSEGGGRHRSRRRRDSSSDTDASMSASFRLAERLKKAARRSPKIRDPRLSLAAVSPSNVFRTKVMTKLPRNRELVPSPVALAGFAPHQPPHPDAAPPPSILKSSKNRIASQTHPSLTNGPQHSPPSNTRRPPTSTPTRSGEDSPSRRSGKKSPGRRPAQSSPHRRPGQNSPDRKGGHSSPDRKGPLGNRRSTGYGCAAPAQRMVSKSVDFVDPTTPVKARETMRRTFSGAPSMSPNERLTRMRTVSVPQEPRRSVSFAPDCGPRRATSFKFDTCTRKRGKSMGDPFDFAWDEFGDAFDYSAESLLLSESCDSSSDSSQYGMSSQFSESFESEASFSNGSSDSLDDSLHTSLRRKGSAVPQSEMKPPPTLCRWNSSNPKPRRFRLASCYPRLRCRGNFLRSRKESTRTPGVMNWSFPVLLQIRIRRGLHLQCDKEKAAFRFSLDGQQQSVLIGWQELYETVYGGEDVLKVNVVETTEPEYPVCSGLLKIRKVMETCGQSTWSGTLDLCSGGGQLIMSAAVITQFSSAHGDLKKRDSHPIDEDSRYRPALFSDYLNT